jgi:hypothetical protein
MPKVLGVRCGSDGYAFGVLEGNRVNPSLLYKSDYIPAPQKMKSQQFQWYYEDFDKIMKKYNPNICVINVSGTPINCLKSGDVRRKENEAIVQLIFAEHNKKEIYEQKNKQLEVFDDNVKALLGGQKTDPRVFEAIRAAFCKLKNGR